jgi:anthranilate synthase component II
VLNEVQMNKPVLIIDNYDSFVYNLVHLIRAIDSIEPRVVRNDEISVAEVAQYPRVLLSPGPGIPNEAGVLPRVVRELSPTHRILGVCLGHQCIGEVFGGELENLREVVHGRARQTIVQNEDYLFTSLPRTFMTGRYHSWVVNRNSIPECLEVVAVDAVGEVMALRHKEYDVRGVQFHPESVLTEHGEVMLRNWLEYGR